MQRVECWDKFEYELQGPSSGNPYVDVKLSARFKYGHRVVIADGFYDGDGIYLIRFMPDQEGEWQFTTISNDPQLNGKEGSFECTPATGNNHGPVGVSNVFHFKYADGFPYRQIGTTCYVWNHQEETLQTLTLKTLEHSPFNKLRMCVFPKHYDYSHNEPLHHVFAGNPQDGWNYRKFNPSYFHHLEKQITRLKELGIEADLILFHPYDRWGFAHMDAETDDFYLRYVVARLSAFRNIWWSMANEYDLMSTKSMNDWDRFFRIVQESDPYQHLRSIHNCIAFYDHGKPWVTHCSIQHADLSKVTHWRETYRKPVVVDECCYEGHIEHRWGNITGQQMTHYFWEGTARGGYVGHGETYIHPNEVLWWSKGGELVGSSPPRIAFLKQILEEGPKAGLDAVKTNRDAACAGWNNQYYLYYVGDRQPSFEVLDFLPEGVQFEIDVIDAWEMTISKAEGLFSKGSRVPLPGKPYMALRIIRKD